ncbi:hypothetical protein LWC34_45850 [Kibdelosporangium philippinense]|uniref:Uncharacterized protein n=2 Tax=Kibdelosporangium philippinense TaxID=211113 RepID=A0ABS8ZR39_9PSEU|nr:hypothetical protein [Kibdelosporangium philippinense]MCE7010082.1 hypothetical protein [Kibdelosporangium philippinense]
MGLSIDADPDFTTIREVTYALFELASAHNVAPLDASTPPMFTQRILLVDAHGQPTFALMGTGISEVAFANPHVPDIPS